MCAMFPNFANHKYSFVLNSVCTNFRLPTSGELNKETLSLEIKYSASAFVRSPDRPLSLQLSMLYINEESKFKFEQTEAPETKKSRELQYVVQPMQ